MACTMHGVNNALQFGFVSAGGGMRIAANAPTGDRAASAADWWSWLGRALGGAAASQPATIWPATATSGHVALDAALPGQGWKSGEVVEVYTPHIGQTECLLLAPLLRSFAAQGRPIGLVGAPRSLDGAAVMQELAAPASSEVTLVHAPQDPFDTALAWLGTHRQGLVLLWITEMPASRWRELQRAARRARAHVFVIRPAFARWDESPAEWRLSLLPARSHALELRIQQRGCPAAAAVRLTIPAGQHGISHGGRATGTLKIACDPNDHRRTVLSGTMAQVCEELDRLAALEARA